MAFVKQGKASTTSISELQTATTGVKAKQVSTTLVSELQTSTTDIDILPISTTYVKGRPIGGGSGSSFAIFWDTGFKWNGGSKWR